MKAFHHPTKLFNQTSLVFPNYNLNNYISFFHFFCSIPSNYGILKLKLQVVRLVKNSYWIWIRAKSLDFKLVQDLISFRQYNDGNNIESLDHIKRKCWFYRLLVKVKNENKNQKSIDVFWFFALVIKELLHATSNLMGWNCELYKHAAFLVCQCAKY